MKTQINPFQMPAPALALALLALMSISIPRVQADGFVLASPMKTARSSHSATLLADGKVLVAGGFQKGASAELYDPGTDTWTATGTLRAARTSHAATLLPNGKVLVAGGVQSGEASLPSTSTELYDPATGTWTLTGPMKRARVGQAAVLLANGKVLVLGGERNGTGFCELYDPASGTWTATGSALQDHPTATLLRNGSVLSGNELYNPDTGAWTSTGAPANEYSTATLLDNGKVLAAGGSRVVAAELYDPVSGTWSPTGSLTWARAACTATLLRNGKVLIAGGLDQDSHMAIPSAEVYDPATGTWTEIPSNEARFQHTATLLANGMVLLAGGLATGPSQLLSSSESYQPDDPGSLTIVLGADRALHLSWAGGILEQTDRLIVPEWRPVPSQTNPQTLPPDEARKFFRVRPAK